MITITRAVARAVALVTVLLALPLAGRAHAQNAVITGRVMSDAGQPVVGANVYIGEMNISVGTDQTGNYTIPVPAARVSGQTVMLRARAIGYAPDQRQITITAGSQTQNFQLRTDITRLSEVVVTGVAEGTERAKLPFTVGRVDVSELPAPSMNALSAIQGRVPGVNIVSATGRPGQAPEVLLRAPTSINAVGRGQEPLYVVDGIVLAQGLPDINPSDIESVEIVKGASAASLYGARAGNGVIQITTRRGARVENSLSFGGRAEYGVSDIERQFGLAENHIYRMNPEGTAFCVQAVGTACTSTFDWASEVLRLNSNTAATPLAPAFSPRNNGTTVWNTFQNGQWPGQTYNAIDQLIDPGNFMQADGQVSGRMTNTNFFASLGYLAQQGSILGLDGYRRGSARLNLDQRVGAAWSMRFSTYYSRSNDDGSGFEGSGATFFDLTRMPRGVNLLMRDTVRNEYIIRPDLAGENENPLYALTYQNREDETDRFLGGMNIQYQPLTWFDMRADLSYDRADNRFSQFNDKSYRTARTSSTNLGQVFKASSANQSWNGSVGATARHEVSTDLRTTLQARASYEQQDFENANLTGRDLAVKGVPDADNARSPQIFITSGESSVRRIGYFLNGIADYKDRYYIDGLVRRDGSSLFGADNRWANFGRLGASWRVGQEPWFNVDMVDELKLRYAIGTAGNSPSYTAQYEVYQLAGGSFTPTTLGNKDLGPERLTEQEMGIDVQLFRKLAAGVTYSTTTTKDQILPVPLPAAAGFQTQWQNAGTLEGNTVEISLEVPWVQRPDFTFNTRFQWDRSRATITELKVAPFTFGTGDQGLEGAFYARVGERYGTIYGSKFATSCADLPDGTDCGQFRNDSNGYFVWTGGADPGSGITVANNVVTPVAGTWGTAGPVLPGRTSAVMWGAPIVGEDATGSIFQPLGNTLPDYRWAFNPTLTYQKFSATALVDANIGRVVYNQGRHWSYFENYSHDQDQAGKAATEIKPIGYYGSAGLYNVLQPNSHFVEDGSFTKLREVTFSYRFGRIPGIGGNEWTATVVGRNLKTWTDYQGFDPEVGRTGGTSSSGVVNAFDAYNFPNLRTFTFALQTTF